MNKTELAIIEQIAQLDEAQQQEVLALTQRLASRAQARSSLTAWLATAQELRAQLRAKYGEAHFFNTQATLDEIREEESE